MFHMSSLKMGLDQAVLKGFESNSGDGALSKDEVEKLLRHGAYDIFNEDKSGSSERESKDFVEQDIDSILARRSRTVVHDGPESGNRAGGTFSKASFKISEQSPSGKKKGVDEIDIEDPDFWKKMVGEPDDVDDEDAVRSKKRSRHVADYSEKNADRDLNRILRVEDTDSEGSDSGEEDSVGENEASGGQERLNWGGSATDNWSKDDVDSLSKMLLRFGYLDRTWSLLLGSCVFSDTINEAEAKRMAWSIMLYSLIAAADDEAKAETTRLRSRPAAGAPSAEGGILASTGSPDTIKPADIREKCFQGRLHEYKEVYAALIADAVTFASGSDLRDESLLDRLFKRPSASSGAAPVEASFASTVWPSLKSRGWSVSFVVDGPKAGQRQYSHENSEVGQIVLVHDYADFVLTLPVLDN